MNNSTSAATNSSSREHSKWKSFEPMFSDVLDTSIELLGADMGYLQIFDSDQQALTIVAQRGFSEEVLTRFRLVGFRSGGASSEALLTGHRVVLEDADRDPLFRHRLTQTEVAGNCSVQSTPLLSGSGDVLATITTHYTQRRTASEEQLRIFDLFVKQTSWFLELARNLQAREGPDALREGVLEALLRQLCDPVKPMLRHSTILLRHLQKFHSQGEVGSSGSFLVAIARDLQEQISLLGQTVEKIQTTIQDETPPGDDELHPHWTMIRNSKSMTSRSLELISGSRSLIEESRNMIASSGRLNRASQD
jgi:hypothetical protein